MLKKASLIKLIDIIAFVTFIFVVSTGVLMRYVLPPKSGQTTEIFGMSRHEWGDVHFYITSLFLAILSIHLILHWRFIQKLFRGRVKEINVSRVLLGLVGLFAVLAIAIAPFIAPKEQSTESKGMHYGKGKQQMNN